MNAALTPVLRAEWIKLRTARATVRTALAAGLVSALLTAWHCHAAVAGHHAGPLNLDPVGASMFGLSIGQFVICVCGALAVTGEYSARTIEATLTATPRRALLLTAKTLTAAGAASAWGLLVAAACFAAGQAALSASPAVPRVNAGHAIASIIGSATALTALALLGFAVALLVRRTAAALVTIVMVLLLAPTLLDPLSAAQQASIGRFLPLQAADELVLSHPVDASHLPPWGAVGVLAGELTALLLLAFALFAKRDA